MKKYNGVKKSVAIAVAVSCSAGISAQDTDGGYELEEVVVTGVRASLRGGIDAKRGADNFVDVIKAEDIGELPDANLAESLQRITGVQIVRDVAASREGLSGQTVNIRGLSSLATINGRTMLAGSLSRDFDFRTLASEGFGELVISKSPAANQIEGGLGGTIELKTRNPNEFEERQLSFTANAITLDYAGTTNPNYSGFYADSFADGRLGVLVSGSYEELDTRTDAYTARGGWIVSNGFTESGFDFDENGTQDLILPSDIRYWYQEDQRVRTGLDTSVVFAAAESLDITFNANYSKLERDFFNGVNRAAGFGATNAVADSLSIDDSGNLQAGTFNDALLQSDGRLEIDNVKAVNYGVNFDWELGDWGVNFDIGRSEGQNEGRQLISRYRLIESPTITYNYNNSTIPSVIVNDGSTDLDDRSLYRADLYFNNPDVGENDETMLRLDIERTFSDGVITKVTGGIRSTDTQYSSSSFRQVGFVDVAGNPVSTDQATGEYIPADTSKLDPILQGFPVDDFFAGQSGDFQRSWVYTSYPDAGLGDGGVYADIYGLTAKGVTEVLGNRTDINEDTFAAYFMADYEFDLGGVPVNGNFGIRYVGTDVSSLGLQTQQDGSQDFAVSEHDYDDILPSLSVVASLSDNLLFRAAFAEVMKRPNIDSLRASLSVDLSDLAGSAGNVELDPYRAKQVDMGLEWYFANEGLLSATVFYKDVENFLSVETETNVNLGLVGYDGGTLFTVKRPVNAGTAEIKGFEVSYQQTFDFLPEPFNNLGAIANYTYADADTSSGETFPELSEQVYNLIAFYDNGRFDARFAYNWRSEYAFGGDGSNGLQFLGISEKVEDGGQLDFSTSYSLTDNFDVMFEVLNITEEDFSRVVGNSSRLREYRTGERRFSLGIRATF
jgi:iron complex outermembrane receptor protein